jgi:mono/diheme cytochrome c family protein
MLNQVAIGTVVLMMAMMAAADAGADDFPVPQQHKAVEAPPPPADTMPPLDRVKGAPKGTLKNPYTDSNAAIVAAGQALYMKSGCNGCHGGGGGGGMCPPLTNDTWVYGGDDDTIFRLVSYGTDELQKAGYTRKGHESVVGPMPQHGLIVKTDDDLWRIITFIRSNYRGSESKKYGDQPPPAAK